MALRLADRIKETTSTSGTGSKVLLGAVSGGWSSFALNYANNETVYYAETNGAQWEVALGTYQIVGGERRISRTQILANSNGNTTPISWPAGTREIFCTLPASKIVSLDDNDEVSIDKVLKLLGETFEVHFTFGGDDDFGFYDYTEQSWVWQYLKNYNNVPNDNRLRIYNYTYLNSGGADEWSIGPNLIRSAAFAEAATVYSGTAVAGTSTTITLPASASSTNDAYRDMQLSITGGTGSGQIKYIRAYNGGTKVATVELPWATMPNNTSVVAIKSGPQNSARAPVLEPDGRLHPDYMPRAVGAQLTTAGVRGVPIEPTAGQQNRFLRGDNTWSNPTITYPVVGTSIPWITSFSFGNTYTVAHGLGGYPDNCLVTFECTNAVNGVTVGTRINYHTYGETGTSRGITVFFDATNIYVRFPTNGPDYASLANGTSVTMSPANWKFCPRAVRFFGSI